MPSTAGLSIPPGPPPTSTQRRRRRSAHGGSTCLVLENNAILDNKQPNEIQRMPPRGGGTLGRGAQKSRWAMPRQRQARSVVVDGGREHGWRGAKENRASESRRMHPNFLVRLFDVTKLDSSLDFIHRQRKRKHSHLSLEVNHEHPGLRPSQPQGALIDAQVRRR